MEKRAGQARHWLAAVQEGEARHVQEAWRRHMMFPFLLAQNPDRWKASAQAHCAQSLGHLAWPESEASAVCRSPQPAPEAPHSCFLRKERDWGG